jgi:uncharacterized surface protein with fasciclin (FAS1) repeats
MGSLVDEATEDTELTTLVAALNASGLTETLASSGPYTLFAPTDTAFNTLMAAMDVTVEDLFANPQALRDILLNHVIAGEIPSNQLMTATSLVSLLEAPITVGTSGGVVLLNEGIQVVRADIPARNGVIHIIDQVLLPVLPAPTPAPTLIPQGTPAFVRIAHLSADMPEVDVYIDGVLSGNASLSVGQVSDWAALPAATYMFSFVPRGALVNEAFFGPVTVTIPPMSWTTVVVVGSSAEDTMQIALLDQNIEEPLEGGNARVTFFNAIEGSVPLDVSLAENLVLFDDIAYGQFAALDLPAETYNIALLSPTSTEPLPAGLPDAVIESGNFYFLTAYGTADSPILSVKAVTAAEIEAITVGVITPTAMPVEAQMPDIVELLALDGRFSMLLAAIDAAGLTETLRMEGPMTLFAPTDEAFAALPEGLLDTLLTNPEALTNVLLYHVVVGDIVFGSPLQGDPLTAMGSPLPINTTTAIPLIAGIATVTEANIPAANGRIQVIDAVLLPPT